MSGNFGNANKPDKAQKQRIDSRLQAEGEWLNLSIPYRFQPTTYRPTA